MFQGMFFDLANPDAAQVNYAVEPMIREYDRMVYLALSEFFFDSGMFSYYQAGIFQTHIANEKVHVQSLTSSSTAPHVLILVGLERFFALNVSQ